MEKRPIKVIGTNVFYETDMTSASGRLIGDYSSGEPHVSQAIATGIDMTLTACPYKGFRRGLPMNQGALREVGSNWQGVLDGLAWVNHVMLDGRKFKKKVPPKEVFTLGEAAHCLPEFLVNRRENAYASKGEIPDVIADIPKVAAGFRTVGGYLITRNEDVNATPKFLADYAEKNELFRSIDKKRVCAGSEPQIVEAGQALIYGQPGNWRNSILNREISDVKQFRDFARGFMRVNYDTHSFKLYIADTIMTMDAAPTMAQMMILMDYAGEEQQYLATMNQFQMQMNRALGFRPEEIPTLDRNDIENEAEFTPYTYMRGLGFPV